MPLLIHIPGITDTKTQKDNRKFSLIDPFLQKTSFMKDTSRDVTSYKSAPSFPQRNGKITNSFSTEQFVELVDMFPTLADLAGLSVPPTCPADSSKTDFCTEGTSLVPLINNVTKHNPSTKDGNKIIRWKNGTFSQYPRPSDTPRQDSDLPHLVNITIMGYSLRTADYRYTEWIGFDHIKFEGNWQDVHGRELYLLQTDSQEDFNMADEPQYQTVAKELSVKLRAGWRYSLPVFEIL